MMSNFEDEYLDVLQNIEFAIVSVYRAERTLSDYDVDKVLNILISEYKAQNIKSTVVKPNLSPLDERLYQSMRHMCEWRLGREALENEDKLPKMEVPRSKSVEEIIACLKRIRKSVEKWNKRGGQRGYLEFIDQFL
jgi:lysyl-tRNA synthetase class II